MRLYLSSYRIPTPDDLEKLIGKPLKMTSVALIPNAKDYYSQRAWNFKINGVLGNFERLGLKVDVVDLREFGGSTLS